MKTGAFVVILIFLCLPCLAEKIMVVMPFTNNSPDLNEKWLNQGLAIMLTEELVQNEVNTISWKVWQRYSESLGIPARVPLSLASAIKIATELGADYLIIGSYEHNEFTIKIDIKSIDLQKGQYLCELVHSNNIQNLLALIKLFSNELLSYLPVEELTTSTNLNIPKDNPPYEALKALIKGLEQTDSNRKVEYLQEAIKIYPNYLRANWELCKEYFRMENYLECEAIARRLVDVPGYDVQANFLLSLSYYYQSRFQEAIRILEGLVNTLPTDQVLNNLGICFLMIGDFEKGLWYLEKAQTLKPEDVDYSFNLGYIFWREGNLDKAIEWLKKVVIKEPSYFQAHWLLSNALRRLDKADEANEEYLLARGYAPDRATLTKLEEGNYALERIKSNIEVIRGIEGLHMFEADNTLLKAELADFYFKQGELMFNKGDIETALRELKKSAFLYPYSARTHFLLAKIYSLQDQKAKAINELKMSIWSKENVPAFLELAKIYHSLQHKEEAMDYVEKCLELEPNNQEALNLKNRIESMEEK